MKKLRLLTIIALIACYILSAAACTGGGSVLETPAGLWVEATNLTLNWNKVENASKYKVDINGESKSTRATSFSLLSLKEGAYTLRVMAVGDGNTFLDSLWSEPYEFVRDAETEISYQLNEDESGYEVTGYGESKGVVTIEDIYRGKPVVAINKNAFYSADRITSIIIGKNVKTIGDGAFYNCGNLESVTLPDGVVEIGVNAFQSCHSLKEIEIPAGVTQIKTGTFSRSGIERVTLPDTIVSIGENAFAYCPQLKEITCGNSLAAIEESAFRECTSLTAVVLPDTLVTIGDNAFLDCTALASVSFGTGLTSLGKHAFSACISLTKITIPESVETIDAYCFYACSALSDISLGAGVKFIGKAAFGETEFLKSQEGLVYLGDTHKWLISNKSTEETNVSVAEDTYGIASYAFENSKLESVKIPNSVQFVNMAAFYHCTEMMSVITGNGMSELSTGIFYGCSKLTYVTFGANVRRICSSAFQGCTLLKTITIPETVTAIEENAFYNTALWNMKENGLVYADNWLVGAVTTDSASIREGTVGISDYAFLASDVSAVEFPEGLKYIGEGAFAWTNLAKRVEIPDSVKEIRDYTFYSCPALTNVYLPNSVTKIGKSVFYECGELTNVHLSTEITEIPDYLFYNCVSLGMLVIPNKVQRIGRAAFYGCTNLGSQLESKELGGVIIPVRIPVKLVLPDSVEEIDEYAFYGSGLYEIGFGKNLKKIGKSAFYLNTNLQSLSLPAGVEEISDFAFYGCKKVEKVSMTNVTKIGRSSFYGCSSLENLSLPGTLKSIGYMAFQDCRALKTLVLPASVEEIGDFAFLCGDVLTIFCESEKAGENWSSAWNMRNRPVIWGCALSADKSYVVSFTMNDSVENYTAEAGINAPYREGYKFDGWLSALKDYGAHEVYNAPNGTQLSASWTETDEPEPELPDEGGKEVQA